MSKSNIKDMGSLSNAGSKIKEKLELSFAPTPPEGQQTLNQAISKSAKPEDQTYGKGDFKTVAVNTEVSKSQFIPKKHQDLNPIKTGNRFKQIKPRAANTIKSKATFCLDLVATEQLTEIYINRLKTHQKSDRSSLICEAISLLYEKEGMI